MLESIVMSPYVTQLFISSTFLHSSLPEFYSRVRQGSFPLIGFENINWSGHFSFGIIFKDQYYFMSPLFSTRDQSFRSRIKLEALCRSCILEFPRRQYFSCSPDKWHQTARVCVCWGRILRLQPDAHVGFVHGVESNESALMFIPCALLDQSDLSRLSWYSLPLIFTHQHSCTFPQISSAPSHFPSFLTPLHTTHSHTYTLVCSLSFTHFLLHRPFIHLPTSSLNLMSSVAYPGKRTRLFSRQNGNVDAGPLFENGA